MAICRGMAGNEHPPKRMPPYVRLCDSCRALKRKYPSQAVTPQAKQKEAIKDLPASGIGGARQVLAIMEKLVR